MNLKAEIRCSLLYRFGTLLFLVIIVGSSNVLCQTGLATDVSDKINPLLPGWFADPTIKKFGDIYYIYATTDNVMLGSGAPTVWYSNDFKHWYNYIMDIPEFSKMPITNFWAPDIVKRSNGKYYLYFGNCEIGCNIYGYVSDSPVGPWKKINRDDTPVIPSGNPNEGFPSLDAQFFEDPDGKIYAYWGTWVHYNGGYAVGEVDTKTMAGLIRSAKIPLEQTPFPFEAPYMMKKGQKYILMYSGGSCHDDTYQVRYSYSDNPYGPFTPGKNNPILSTTLDGNTHGPGHHSILSSEGKEYIVYHRHDYPFTAGGLSRQICIDELVFENDSTILSVIPASGSRPDLSSSLPEDIAQNSPTVASSFYHLESTTYDYKYEPNFATDHDNSTMWKAASNEFPQSITVDLGEVKKISRVATSFEFASYYYQYLVEYSTDGKRWRTYADRSSNMKPGSPMIDDNLAYGRYVRITVVNVQKNGMYAAIWDLRIYSEVFSLPLNLKNRPASEKPTLRTGRNMLVNIDAQKIDVTGPLHQVENIGSMQGAFSAVGSVSLGVDDEGVKAFKFENAGALILDKPVPKSLEWNGSFTIATWVKNPEISDRDECIYSWCNRNEKNLANSYAALYFNSSHYGAVGHLESHFDMSYRDLPEVNKWHFIVLTFDGVNEKIYVDGKLDNSQNMALSAAVRHAKFRIGASDVDEYFTGWIASLQMYDYALTKEQILVLMNKSNVLNRSSSHE